MNKRLFEVGDYYKGKAYRVLTGYSVKNLTVQDVIDFESNELGNTHVSIEANSVLEIHSCISTEIPASHVVWVTAIKDDARRYGSNPEEFFVPDYSLILSIDGDGGYLVLLNKYYEKVYRYR